MLGIETLGSHAKLKGLPESPTIWQALFWLAMAVLSGIGFLLCLAILFS